VSIGEGTVDDSPPNLQQLRREQAPVLALTPDGKLVAARPHCARVASHGHARLSVRFNVDDGMADYDGSGGMYARTSGRSSMWHG